MGGEVTDTSPFPGASRAYSRAYRLLEWMGANGYVEQIKAKRKGRLVTIQCHVSETMRDLITALDKADEEVIKWFIIHPDYLKHTF